MEALMMSYGSASDSDDEDCSSSSGIESGNHAENKPPQQPHKLPPPPLDLLYPLDYFQTNGNRVRSFPHVQGNYAVHVFIPGYALVNLLLTWIKKALVPSIRRVACLVEGLHVVDIDIPLSDLCIDDQKILQIVLGQVFHISLSRTVPIRVHQIDSIVTMLRQKLQSQKRYWIEFTNWTVFTNDDHTRTFLSMEITEKGLYEITRLIQIVNDVCKLHNLPEFYENPRPHISLAWGLGDISELLHQAVNELNRTKPSTGGGLTQKNVFSCAFNDIQCKIGKKTHICKDFSQ